MAFKAILNGKLGNSCTPDKTTYEGSRIDGLVSKYELQQLIDEPTHRTGGSFSCIDLLFCSNQS